MQVKPDSIAFSLFNRWRDSRTLLRASFRTDSFFWDVEGVVDRVDPPLIGVRLEDCGFIEFLFDTQWRYDFEAPDTMHAKPEAKLGRSSLNSRVYEFGEMMFATRTDGTKWMMTFFEIVKPMQ
jgi:hypothetical protein